MYYTRYLHLLKSPLQHWPLARSPRNDVNISDPSQRVVTTIMAPGEVSPVPGPGHSPGAGGKGKEKAGSREALNSRDTHI